MDVADIITDHYGAATAGIGQRVRAALAAAGKDPERVGFSDLAAYDELHAGGLAATQHLLAQLALTPTSRLLDVGSGIGGAARAAAATYSCQVTGVDLTEQFVATATELTALVGLAGRVSFRTTSAQQLPFEDAAFDRAMMIHVGMNVADKAAVFGEVRRVLDRGGRFAVYDQMRLAPGPLTYPLPWAQDESSSFLCSPAEYEDLLGAAGFEVLTTEDRTPAAGGPPAADANAAAAGPDVVFGAAFAQRIANNLAAARAGVLGAVLVLARAV